MKKEARDIVKNGRNFKLIIKYDSEKNIQSIMEKPNTKTWTQADFNVVTSGAHVFSNPEFNHVDFFQSGASVSREYPKIRGSTNYGYNISGAILVS